MEKGDEKHVEGTDPAYDILVGDIVATLRGVQELCRQHGIFDGLRELFRCTHCGLREDVSGDSRLLTYHDIDNPVDTGLRFPEPDDDGYSRCPECGEVVRLEEGEDENRKEGE
jgi:hypothetical protein